MRCPSCIIDLPIAVQRLYVQYKLTFAVKSECSRDAGQGVGPTLLICFRISSRSCRPESLEPLRHMARAPGSIFYTTKQSGFHALLWSQLATP